MLHTTYGKHQKSGIAPALPFKIYLTVNTREEQILPHHASIKD